MRLTPSVPSPAVKRIVMISSIAAVGSDAQDTPLDETHWNDLAVDSVNEQGIDANAGLKYSASKTLAERAAWDFMEKHRGTLAFDFVTSTPSFVSNYFVVYKRAIADSNLSTALGCTYRTY